MLRHSDLVTSSAPLPPPPSSSPHFVGHGRVPIAVSATIRAGDGQEKIQPVKARHVGNDTLEMKKYIYISAIFFLLGYKNIYNLICTRRENSWNLPGNSW